MELVFVAKYWKEIAGALVAAVLLTTVVVLKHETNSLKAWQEQVVYATTDATVTPGKDGKKTLLDPAKVPTAINALRASRDAADAQLTSLSAQALNASARSKSMDQKLAETLAEHDKQAGELDKALAALKARKPTGNATMDCAVMGDDSKAAYSGWRK